MNRYLWTTLVLTLTATTLSACGSGGSASHADTPSASAATTTTAPRHTGPYAIGRRDEVFVDATRKTASNGALPGKPGRTLETIIEYPAQGRPDPNTDTEGARPADGTFPVVVFVHGFGAHADNPYLHPLAAAGYVAVSIKFPLTNTDTPGGPAISDTFNEPADVEFVLAQLGHLPVRDADLQRVMDARRVGLLGQSLGAVVAFDMAYNSRHRDPRVGAVVAMSGGCVACWQSVGQVAGSYFTGQRVPVLFVHGTEEPFIPPQGARIYAQTPPPKFWLDLVGAHHVQYGAPWEAITAKATVDFFDRYLRNDADGVRRLTADANVPKVARLRKAVS